VSRLIDRILSDGLRELRASDIYPDWFARAQISEQVAAHGENPAVASLLRDRLDPRFTAPDEEALVRRLVGVPVFCADEVGRWCETVPYGSNVFDIVSVLAPPYPAFWVEVQGVANQHHAHAFGALVTDITAQVNRGETSRRSRVTRAGLCGASCSSNP
jgi:hypothetical protein